MRILSDLPSIKLNYFSPMAIIKISIIILMSIYLLGNFNPFFYEFDGNVYANIGIDIANGSLEYSDPAGLLKETGKWEYVPHPLVKSVHDTAVPVGGLGIYVLSAISYIIGGYYGLFYLGPIITILFLIIAERVSTKLFGSFIGLVTLLFLSSDTALSYFGSRLLTDIIFSAFVVLGCYYLIRFLGKQKKSYILLCSIFLATSSLFRVPGMIFFPVELLIIIGFFTFGTISNLRSSFLSGKIKYQSFFQKIKSRNILIISAYIIIPWIVYFLIMSSLNSYYFNEAYTLNYSERPFPPGYHIDSIFTFFKFDLDRIEWWLFYSVSLLPDALKNTLEKTPTFFSHEILGNIGIGIYSTIIWFLALGISILLKKNRTKVIVLFIFSTSFLLFYSGSYLHSESYNIENYQGPSIGNQNRHMLPILTFSFIFVGFIFNTLWKFDLKKNIVKPSKIFSKFFQYVIIILIVLLLIVSFYSSPPVKSLLNSNFQLKNPMDFSDRYPLDSESLSENSIIVGGRPGASLEYDSISFFPYWEYMPTIRQHEFNPDMVPQEPIILLKEKIADGHDVYVFKSSENRRSFENQYYQYLADEHNLILKDFSMTFCKMEFIETNNGLDESSFESDSKCYQFRFPIN